MPTALCVTAFVVDDACGDTERVPAGRRPPSTVGAVATITWGKDVAEIYDARRRRCSSRPCSTRPSTCSPSSRETGRRSSSRSAPAASHSRSRPRRARSPASSCRAPWSPSCGRSRARRRLAVTIGDMTTTRVEGTFSLVYLVFNTIMNVTTQDEQVAVFANAAAHLEPGGCFVVEVVVPQLRRLAGRARTSLHARRRPRRRRDVRRRSARSRGRTTG